MIKFFFYLGIYTCKAESEHGLTNTSCEVVVPSKEVVEVPVIVEEKQEVPIHVEVHEAPPPSETPVAQKVAEHTEAPPPTGKPSEFESKSYVDQTVYEEKQKEEEFAEVTEIKKKEEEYKLLVKVRFTETS